MPLPQPQKFLSVAAVCERYGVSRSTIYAWINEGRLPKPIAFTARCVRWTQADLQDFEQGVRHR